MTPIRALSVLLVDCPIVRPHQLAMTTMHHQTCVLVTLLREDGLIGVGEAATIVGAAYVEESPESIASQIKAHFAPVLIGMDADQPAACVNALNAAIVGNRFAKAAVETALYDAFGQATGLPMSAFFGGQIHARLPVLWTLASGDLKVDIAEAEALLKEGRHTRFKVKIGRQPVIADCAHLAALTRHFDGRADFTVDVNQRWSRSEAAIGARLLGECGVVLLEQPIAATDLQGLAQLSRTSPIPILADEALTGPEALLAVCAADAASVVSIKIAQAGGLQAASAMANIARASHRELYGGTMLEGPIGTLASAHMFATFPKIQWGTELFGPLLQAQTLTQEPLDFRDGCLVLPSGPGLSIKPDWDRVQQLARPDQAMPDIPGVHFKKRTIHAVHGGDDGSAAQLAK